MITPQLLAQMQARVEELATRGDTFWTRQFSNPDNRSAYHVMAEELIRETDGQIQAFVMGVGTGGCFSGNAEVLRQRLPKIRCVAVEPDAARVLSGGPVTGHHIEGLTAGFVSPITRTDLIDEIIAVTDDDAVATARDLARKEGIFCGVSTGANVWAALQIAARLGPGVRVATIAVDSGLKYLQGHLFA